MSETGTDDTDRYECQRCGATFETREERQEHCLSSMLAERRCGYPDSE